jgi:hypothetical protein
MAADRLTRYARLPRAYRDRTVLHSTVDAFGHAHWLLRDSAQPDGPYDAVAVTVEDGRAHETHLSAVRPRHPLIDALPDGGFVLADVRRATRDDQVQVFDALGRPSWHFRVGDGIEHLLADESGDLWVGHFDEGVVGDRLSEPGVRRWSSTGTPLWAYRPSADADHVLDCYALNVDRRAAWVYPYTGFPLIEVRDGRVTRVRKTPVRYAHGVVVHGEQVAFFGGVREAHDRLVTGTLTETAVEPGTETRLTHPDGAALGRRRVICRGSRLYVQPEPFTEWLLLDIGDGSG